MPRKEDLIVYTYSDANPTPKMLQEELNCRRICKAGTRNVRAVPDGTLIVNWGYGRVPEWAYGKNVRYLNHPSRVYRKIGKLSQIKRFAETGVPSVVATSDRTMALMWLNGGQRVLARQEATFGGQGIQIISPGDELPASDFYSLYFDKTHEYRYHVFRDKIIDIVQKKRRNGVRDDGLIRSFAHGWIEAHYNKFLPEATDRILSRTAIAAVQALGLDFGAVDIIARHNGNTLEGHQVCEVNAAPGCGQMERSAYIREINEVYNAGRG